MMKGIATIELFEFVDSFGEALVVELAEDDDRLGENWHGLSCENIFECLDQYIADYDIGDIPVPWLKVALLAMVAWIRENRPDLFPVSEPEEEIPF